MIRRRGVVVIAAVVILSGSLAMKTVVAYAAPGRALSWLAAGDSYSSGEGLPHSTGVCARADEVHSKTWADVASDDLKHQGGEVRYANPPELVACTGATTSEMLDSADPLGTPEWTPAMGQYDLVTFTFGGDDIGFAPIIEQCIGLSRLVATVASTLSSGNDIPYYVSPLPSDPGHSCPSAVTIEARIAALADTYRQLLTEIANEVVTPGGNIVVLGYPELVELPKYWRLWEQKVGSCWGIGTGDATALRGLAGDLDAAIGSAVSAVNAQTPNGVHITFVNVNTANDGNSPADRDLFEPSSGSRHNMCSSDPWLNGGSIIDYGSGSFHPKEPGLIAEGALAAAAIAKLDWSHLGTSQQVANAQLNQLTPGMEHTLVKVPGGWEAASFDQNGHIDFWKLEGQGPWMELSQSNYPLLPEASPQVSVAGALLRDMSDATYLVRGVFSGDGSANDVIFGPGPNGYGILTQASPTSPLSSDGHGESSTSSSSWDRQFAAFVSDGQLVTEQNSGAFDDAFASAFPLIVTWRWEGNEFIDATDNIVTAQAAAAPSVTAPPLPSGAPPDGSYAIDINEATPQYAEGSGFPALALLVSPMCNQLVNECGSQVTITIPADTTTIYPEDAPGSPHDTVRYISGPAWPIAGFAQDWGPDVGSPFDSSSSWDKKGLSPWYIPPSLVLAGSSLFVEANVPGVATFRGGQVTSIALYDPLGE